MKITTAVKSCIAVTFVPDYGRYDECIEGFVCLPEGENSFDRYRLTLFLQVEDGGRYWIKPTFAEPITSIERNGAFMIRFVTGGSDQNAVKLCVLLLYAANIPQSTEYGDFKAAALDEVVITRDSANNIGISPLRNAPVMRHNTVQIPALKDKIAVDVNFYVNGLSPNYGSKLDERDIVTLLERLRPIAHTLRFFGASGEAGKAYRLAFDMGFKIIGNAWLSGDAEADRKELAALAALANKGYIIMAVAGSETVLRGDLNVHDLADAIQYLRGAINDKALPITTADTFAVWNASLYLRSVADVIFVNAYPYWENAGIRNALQNFTGHIDTLLTKNLGRQVICSETGWPSQGEVKFDAVPSEENCAAYFNQVRRWSYESGIPVMYFEAFDEAWKASDEGVVGGYWGIFAINEDGSATLKPGIEL